MYNILRDISFSTKIASIFVLLSLILAGVYFLPSVNNNNEIPVLIPPKGHYKIQAKIEEDLLNYDNNRTIYENFSKKPKNIGAIMLAPDPEAPMELSENLENDIFALQNSSPIDKLPLTQNIVSAPRDESTNVTNDVRDAENNKQQTNLEAKSIWDIEEKGQEEIKNQANKDNNLNITHIQQVDITPKNLLKTKLSYYIQLGVYRSSDEAQKQWTKTKLNHKKLLGSMNPQIKKIKKPTGVYYELLAGPYKEFKPAKYICTKISLKNQKCIVVRKNL
ncbi:MAG: SPOR domain-containing protein [Rickettsiaceae bacterium]|nr:SPOR domain-containing protein [Rickettsiaceae bacterium]